MMVSHRPTRSDGLVVPQLWDGLKLPHALKLPWLPPAGTEKLTFVLVGATAANCGATSPSPPASASACGCGNGGAGGGCRALAASAGWLCSRRPSTRQLSLFDWSASCASSAVNLLSTCRAVM